MDPTPDPLAPHHLPAFITAPADQRHDRRRRFPGIRGARGRRSHAARQAANAWRIKDGSCSSMMRVPGCSRCPRVHLLRVTYGLLLALIDFPDLGDSLAGWRRAWRSWRWLKKRTRRR